MAELVIDQVASVVDQVRSIRIDAEQPSFGVQHNPIAVLAEHLATGQVWRTKPVGRIRRHDVGVQSGRLPDRQQFKPPAAGAAPASWVIQHPLDQYGSFVGIDGQPILNPDVITD